MNKESIQVKEEENAIKFAEWLAEKQYSPIEVNNERHWFLSNSKDPQILISTKDLYKIFSTGVTFNIDFNGEETNK